MARLAAHLQWRQKQHTASCSAPPPAPTYVIPTHLLDVNALRGQEEQDGEHAAVPGAVDEDGGQQVARPHVGEAQQEAQRDQLLIG